MTLSAMVVRGIVFAACARRSKEPSQAFKGRQPHSRFLDIDKLSP